MYSRKTTAKKSVYAGVVTSAMLLVTQVAMTRPVVALAVALGVVAITAAWDFLKHKD